MRKLLVLLLPVLLSCTLDNTTITNNSGEVVEVTFSHIGPLRISSGQTISVETRYHMPIISYTPEGRVRAVHHGLYLIVFEDRTEIFPIHVMNFSDTRVRLTIQGWTDPPNISMVVDAGGVEDQEYYSFSPSLQFEAFVEEENVLPFPMHVTHSFDGEVFLVSIH